MKDASWLPRRQKNAKLFPFFAGKLFDHSRLDWHTQNYLMLGLKFIVFG